MSQLTPFVRAFRALQVGFGRQSYSLGEAGRSEAGLAAVISDAFATAATDLEQQIAADLSRVGRIPPRAKAEPSGGDGIPGEDGE